MLLYWAVLLINNILIIPEIRNTLRFEHWHNFTSPILWMPCRVSILTFRPARPYGNSAPGAHHQQGREILHWSCMPEWQWDLSSGGTLRNVVPAYVRRRSFLFLTRRMNQYTGRQEAENEVISRVTSALFQFHLEGEIPAYTPSTWTYSSGTWAFVAKLPYNCLLCPS